jgi:hypothetical protein
VSLTFTSPPGHGTDTDDMVSLILKFLGTTFKIYLLKFWTLSIVLSLILKHNVSETRFCLSLGDTGSETGTNSVDWAHLSRYHMNSKTECSLRNVMF